MSLGITVLGVGNTIMGDDGIGPAILARLQELRGDDARLHFEDGGLGGMQLLDVVQDCRRLLIVDAVASDQPGGTVVRVAGDQVPRMLSAKLSPHQVGVLDVLTAARLLGKEPELVEVVGVVPELVDLQVGLTEVVSQAIEPAAQLACQVLDQWLAEPC